jgi:hypothetical protein
MWFTGFFSLVARPYRLVQGWAARMLLWFQFWSVRSFQIGQKQVKSTTLND